MWVRTFWLRKKMWVRKLWVQWVNVKVLAWRTPDGEKTRHDTMSWLWQYLRYSPKTAERICISQWVILNKTHNCQANLSPTGSTIVRIYFIFLFIAIETRIFDVGTKWNYVHNVLIAIYPCFKFHEKILRTFKVIAGFRKVWQTDWLTNWRTHRVQTISPLRWNR